MILESLTLDTHPRNVRQRVVILDDRHGSWAAKSNEKDHPGF